MLEDPRVDPYLTKNTYASQKLHRAKALDLKGEFEQAQDIAKAVAFDALRTRDLDLLRLAYLRLADLETDDENLQFTYILGALEAADFNGPIYVRTCLNTVFRMKTMDSSKVIRLCQFLQPVVQGEFLAFIIALSAKLTGHNYSTLEIPDVLVLELSKFRYKETL